MFSSPESFGEIRTCEHIYEFFSCIIWLHLTSACKDQPHLFPTLCSYPSCSTPVLMSALRQSCGVSLPCSHPQSSCSLFLTPLHGQEWMRHVGKTMLTAAPGPTSLQVMLTAITLCSTRTGKNIGETPSMMHAYTCMRRQHLLTFQWHLGAFWVKLAVISCSQWTSHSCKSVQII